MNQILVDKAAASSMKSDESAEAFYVRGTYIAELH